MPCCVEGQDPQGVPALLRGQQRSRWAGEITYFRTTAGWSYLAVWIDLFSRRIVGWKLDSRMDAVLVIEALNGATATER